MKLSSRSQIESLARFQSRGFLTTSLFLETDKSRLTKKEIQVSLKNLLSDGRSRLEAVDASKEKKESLERDLDLAEDFFHKSLPPISSPGAAVFACSGLDRMEAFELPHGPRSRLIFDTNFYLRPLSAILDKYHQICVLLLGRRDARWYEIFAGEIKDLASLRSDVPSKVREGGFEGTESKRIERHIDAHLQDHFKKAAQTTFDLNKKKAIEWLFLGGEDNHFSDFESHLHRYLKDKVKGRLKARAGDSPAKILRQALDLEKELKKSEEEGIVRNLITELERGGLACSGVRDTLRSTNRFEIQTLVVTHQFSKPGRMCPNHKFLYVDEPKCPSCQKRTEIVADVIDEAIEFAYKRGCPVRHITPPSKLDRYGHIGAFLKFKA